MPISPPCSRPEKASGHAFRNRRAVKGSPMKVTSNPESVVSTAPAAFSGDGRILTLQTENDLSKWPFPIESGSLVRRTSHGYFRYEQIQRATIQRIRRQPGQSAEPRPQRRVIVCTRFCADSREASAPAADPAAWCASAFSASCRSVALSKGRHAAPARHVSVGECLAGMFGSQHIAEIGNEGAPRESRQLLCAKPTSFTSVSIGVVRS